MRSFLHRTRPTAIALLLALLAALSLGGGAGAAETAPTINKPADQAGVTGKATTVTVTGTNLATLTAKGLPAGVSAPVKVSATEWTIEGTPTTAETTTVILEAENAEKVPGAPVEFKWTVAEPEAAPTIAKPSDQAGVRGKAVSLTVSGTNLATLNATGLPAGVGAPVKVSATAWKIEGTPTTAETTTVTLEAKNAEGAPGTPVEFKWTVSEPEPAPTITKPVDKSSVAGRPASLTVTGTKLATLEAKGLPKGVTALVKVSESEWKIEGEPTTAETATVTLEAKNAEGAPGTPVEFKWTVSEPEPAPAIAKPADQSSTTGTAIAPVAIGGSNLATLAAKGLPTGLGLTKVSETEWQITGTPTVAQAAATVTLEATNKEGATASVTFVWTVSAPAAPPAEPTPTPTPTPTPAIPSAGRLGTVPVQKQGRELFTTFLCEVARCKVTITATIKAGKSTFKVRSNVITILQGKKPRIPLRIKKKQRELISAALKKHQKVTAALSASIDSSVGKQLTRALLVTVKR